MIRFTADIIRHSELRVHEKINLHFSGVEVPGMARREYRAYLSAEQHRQAGYIGLLKCEVIFE